VFCREITYKYYRISTTEDTTVANVLQEFRTFHTVLYYSTIP